MKETQDEAARLWKILERKRTAGEGRGRFWLGVALVAGLFVLLTGLWIVVMR